MSEQDLNSSKPQLKDHLTVIKTDVLPPQIRVFVTIIGLAETIKLLQARGGAPIRIPESSKQADVLSLIISPESVSKLRNSHLAGKMISCPKVDKLLQQVRNMDILSQKGITSRRQLAQRYDLSTRHVQNIWSDGVNEIPVNDAPDDQLSFGFK
jgi:Mor family transcriptional regulator